MSSKGKKKQRRILVPVTDTLAEAFKKFRSRHCEKSWSDALILRLFAEAGVKVWEHEQLGVVSIPARYEIESPSFVNKSTTPTSIPTQTSSSSDVTTPISSKGKVVPEDNFPFEGIL